MALLPLRPLTVALVLFVFATLLRSHAAHSYILADGHGQNGLTWMRPQFRRVWSEMTDVKATTTPSSTTISPVTTTIGPPENTLTESRELISHSAEESRGLPQRKKHRHHHMQKMHKKRMLYPVLIGLFIAKSIIFPMLLKALTIMSSASFMLSKMSLLTSVLLGFKWFLSSQQAPIQQAQPTILRVPDSPKVEVVHVPVKKYSDWDRENDRPHAHGNNVQHGQSDGYDGGYGYGNDHDQMKPSSSYS